MQKRVAGYVSAVFLFAACSGGSSLNGVAQNDTAPVRQTAAPVVLSAAGQQELRSIVDNGRLADLQWPNFSDEKAAVKDFYTDAGYQLAWTRDRKPTSQALELIDLLKDADQKGLDNQDYDGAKWADRMNALQVPGGTSESMLVKFDVALTVSAIRYGSDVHLGKVDPKVLHKDFDPDREKHDPGEFLWKNVVNAPNAKTVLAQIEPPYPGYQRALAALQKYLQMAREEVPEPLPQVNKPISPGQAYEDVGKLVKRLQFLGDIPPTVPVPEHATSYSGPVVDGVKHFQARHGLDAQGKLGPQTITEVNRPMSERVEALRLTLERWRWVPHSFAQPPIVVNIPEFLLRAYDAPGAPALIMRVVVGRAMRTETPVLEEDMKYVIFWPYWNVPPSILRGEIVPKLTKDAAYIQKNNFEVTTYSGQVVTDGVVSDEVLAQLRAGKLMVRQKPGPKNALGLIKFIFPNDNNVYLHSTPAQALFSETRRDFSHGCIRAEDPKALAVWVLRNNPGWTRERVEAAFKAEKQEQVNLTYPIPVLIVYGTAVAKEDGQVYFFSDIYGNDKKLEKLFNKAYASQK